MNTASFKKRSYILLGVLCCWALFISFKFFYYSIWQRSYYLIVGGKLSTREGYYSAGRGRILDSDGIPLAWSERHYDLLILDLPNAPEYREKLLRKLRLRLQDVSLESADDVSMIVKRSLSGKELEILGEMIPRHPCLKIKTRLVRRIIEQPDIRHFIGKVKRDGCMLRGSSGCEKVFDKVLSGKPGKYTIMLDRNKNWIPGTFRQTAKAVSGSDVRIPYSLEEIRTLNLTVPGG